MGVKMEGGQPWTVGEHLQGSAFISLLAVAAVQVVAALAVLSMHRFDAWLRRALPFVISMAVGVLLATGAAHLLPEAVEALGNRSGVWVALVGSVLALYVFERGFHLVAGVRSEPAAAPEDDCGDGHSHGHSHHGASRPAALLLGCVTHSLVDGTSVAAAFTIDARVGWITAVAVALHEIPHRLGDFALLVHMGVRRGRAAVFAIAAGGSALLGWGIVALLGEHGSHRVAWLLPVSAGSFLYISLVDLLPELQNETRPRMVVWQVMCLIAGVALALGLTHLPGA
jgi:zinc and cadmium transporter